MIYKTNGLVLNYIRFRETSIICKIFTESFGLQAYIINSISSPARWLKVGIFSLQTSDVARLSLIIFLAYYLRNTRLIDNI